MRAVLSPLVVSVLVGLSILVVDVVAPRSAAFAQAAPPGRMTTSFAAGSGDGITAAFLEDVDADALVDIIETAALEAIDILAGLPRLPGAKGLIHKLEAIFATVVAALADYEAGAISRESFVARLTDALEQLHAFDNQLEAKARSGRWTIPADEADALRERSAAIRAAIEQLLLYVRPGEQSLDPPPGTGPPPLFDPDSADATDRAAAALIAAWRARPGDDQSAQAYRLAVRESLEALRAEGPAAADRIALVCAGEPVLMTDRLLPCLRLLGHVESGASIDLLRQHMLTPTPSRPPVVEQGIQPPQSLARRAAGQALAQRARAGSEPALAALLEVVAAPAAPDRRLAVQAVFGALPRYRAKALLRPLLPAGEGWRLYEVR